MQVRKRNGDDEPVDVNKIVRAVDRVCDDLADVDPMRVATRTISGLYDGATTAELDRLSIQTAAEMIGEEPQYSRLAARLLAGYIDKEVRNQGVMSFSQSVALGHAEGLIGDETARFVKDNARKLDFAIDPDADRRFEYFGLRTVYDRYLLRHPSSRLVVETPQYFLLRVASGLARTPAEAIEFYRLMSSLAYLPSSPTLFNSGTRHTQMSSCYLVDSPRDDLDSIYARYQQVARLSKFAGGIGIAFSRVRSRGALIRGTNGASNGIVPFLRTLDSSVAAVNQGGRRKGAACVYLEPWHPDVEEFLELKDNTGEDARRTHNLNLANWIPDEFMRRVEADAEWSLIDPDQAPELPDLWGEAFDAAYRRAEEDGRYVRKVKARELYGKMMRTLAQTGNGWLTFKDAANRTCNQTSDPSRVPGGPVVHLSNLCTEIIEVSSDSETAVCNLGSINLAQHLTAVRHRLGEAPHHGPYGAAAARPRHRRQLLPEPGGRGVQPAVAPGRARADGAAGRVLRAPAAVRLPRGPGAVDADPGGGLPDRARGLLRAGPGARPAPGVRRHEGGRRASCSRTSGPTRHPEQTERWDALRAQVAEHGLRNSLLIAIAPTATIASIAGCYECIEPQVSNLFKRETLSGEFLQVNAALTRELKERGLWTAEVRDAIKRAEGSVQGVAALPEDVRMLFRTAWELPQRALIDMAAARAPYIDQSQSLNLFIAGPSIGKLSSMYLHAWKSGLKTTYYLRSRPATRIQQTTVTATSTDRPSSAVACSAREPRDLRGLPMTTTTDTDQHQEPARPRARPDPAADALPALLRPVPRRHQEHVDGRGGRPALRPQGPAAAHRRRAAPGLAAGGVLRDRRHHRRRTTWC